MLHEDRLIRTYNNFNILIIMNNGNYNSQNNEPHNKQVPAEIQPSNSMDLLLEAGPIDKIDKSGSRLPNLGPTILLLRIALKSLLPAQRAPVLAGIRGGEPGPGDRQALLADVEEGD